MNIDDLPAGSILDALVAKLMGEPHVSAQPYSQDLNLAWRVALAFSARGVSLELSIRTDHDGAGSTTFLACFTREADLCLTMNYDTVSPAAAICRAALKMAHQPVPEELPAMTESAAEQE